MLLQLEILAEHLLNGLTLGALYAMVTLGLVLTFSVINLVNFAHGDMFMVAGFISYFLLNLTFKLPFIIVIFLVMALTALFAALLELVAIDRIIDKSWRTHAITTIGISIILQNLALILFTGDPRQVTIASASKILTFGDVRISVLRIIILVVALLVVIGLQWFVKYTKPGKIMRAVSQNREMCAVVGINVRQVAVLTFALSGVVTGLAAVLITPMFTVYPTMGSLLTLKALAAIVMGGMGGVNGPILSAFLIGIVELLFGGYVSFAYKDVISYGMFLLVLFLRPQGLFGKKSHL